MAQGSLEQKGGKVGFEGIGADIKPLMKQFEQLRKQVTIPKYKSRFIAQLVRFTRMKC